MTARTHDLFAFSFLVTAACVITPAAISVPTLFTSVIGNVVGALIPDMDQASNRLWDLLPGGNAVGKIFRHLFLGHRTISHSLLGAFLLYQLLLFSLPKIFNVNYVNTNILLVSIMLGFVSHLFADSLTKEGIPLFFPFGIKIGFPPIKLFRIKTDSWVEHLVVLPLLVVYIAFIFVNNQSTFLSLFHSVAS